MCRGGVHERRDRRSRTGADVRRARTRRPRRPTRRRRPAVRRGTEQVAAPSELRRDLGRAAPYACVRVVRRAAARSGASYGAARCERARRSRPRVRARRDRRSTRAASSVRVGLDRDRGGARRSCPRHSNATAPRPLRPVAISGRLPTAAALVCRSSLDGPVGRRPGPGVDAGRPSHQCSPGSVSRTGRHRPCRYWADPMRARVRTTRRSATEARGDHHERRRRRRRRAARRRAR